jgi:hypothetical protein
MIRGPRDVILSESVVPSARLSSASTRAVKKVARAGVEELGISLIRGDAC